MLRKIDRPDHQTVLWVPAGLGDDEYRVDDAYAHDTERMVEAVDRAEERWNTPAVPLEMVTFEVERDPALRLTGSSAPYQVLSDASKETVAVGSGKRRERQHQLIHRVGRVDGRTYFTTGSAEVARQYLRALDLEVRWRTLDGLARRDGLANCELPSVAYGRGLELIEEMEALLAEAVELADTDLREDLKRPVLEVEAKARSLCDDLEIHLDGPEVDAWWPEEVVSRVEGYTAEQHLEVVQPVYPAAQGLDDAHDLVPRLEGRIWRVPNPDHTRRYDDDPERAAEHLFERTSALTYVARRWCGTEAKLQGMRAASQLRRLRDIRFVLPALESENSDRRLAGVACAAFLGDERALPYLERLAEKDSDPGVRDSAAWAYRLLQAEREEVRSVLLEERAAA